jgi:FMN phosphatase YigB (HAD superfamily)
VKLANITAVFFDFDGVLGTDRFYTTLGPEYAAVTHWINRNVFSGEKYCDAWMRGELSWWDINKIIAAATGMDCELLDEKLEESVRLMQVNHVLIELAEKLKRSGIKVALVTNNMDIFNDITVPEKGLDKVFPVIVNSFDCKLMKHDEDGRIFDIAREKLGLPDFKDILLFDDTQTYCEIFRKKGGQAFQYENQEAFLKWVKDSIPLAE